MPTLRHLVAQANEEFTSANNEGPYTSFKQIQLLLRIAGKSVHDLVQDPVATFADLTSQVITEVCNSGHPLVQDTWNRKAGRCTALSLRIADRLTRKYPGQYEFEHFTVPRGISDHRLSRCKKTGIIIDVISNIGALVVPEGHSQVVTTNETITWRFDQGQLYLIDEDGDEEVCTRVSHVVAQALCLNDVARSAQLICEYRDANPKLLNQNIFGNKYKAGRFNHGVMKWKLKPDTFRWNARTPGKKELSLKPEHTSEERSRIIWGPRHTDQDAQNALREVSRFLRTYGGPYAEEQWRADGVNEFVGGIWAALSASYGNPR
ncbi:hypothetical protein ACLX1H_004958 [Fusarium chlamydosporum]